MEPNEVQELHEQHEHAAGEAHHGAEGGGGLKIVSFTMSVLAVLVAVVTVVGHRTHTEAVLNQARASDMWNLYQAKKIRQNDTLLSQDLLTVVAVGDRAGAEKLLESYRSHQAKWNEDIAEEQEQAKEFEEEVAKAERRAGRFDLSEALLEIGLVVTSITLLTRQRVYWGLGMVFGALGLAVTLQGLLLR